MSSHSRFLYTQLARILPMVLVAAVLSGVPATAQPPDRPELVAGDAAAETMVARLADLDREAAIRVLAKHRETHPVTGDRYVLLKVELGDRDLTCSLNERSGAFALDPGLASREAAALLAGLPPAYGKMRTNLLQRVREAQEGRLGGAGGRGRVFAVVFHAGSASGLDEIEAALSGFASRRFDAAARWAADPPWVHPDVRSEIGTIEPPEIRVVTAELPLSEILRVGAMPAVVRIDEHIPLTPRLDQSVPRVGGDDVKNFTEKGFNADVGIVDTGIDDTHPDSARVIAEINLSTDPIRCIGGPDDGTRCLCPQSICDGSTCVAGPAAGQACVINCTNPGVCADPVDDLNGHGTHVAGIAGNRSATFEGMAPRIDLINAKAIGGGAAEAITAGIFSRGAGADIVNASYAGAGAVSNGLGVEATAMDHEVYVHNITYAAAAEELPFKGRCSNDAGRACANHPDCTAGGTCLAQASTPNDAFNAITVGASNLTTDPSSWALFSQVGPTADGRSKPDVLAPGDASSCVGGTNDGQVCQDCTAANADCPGGMCNCVGIDSLNARHEGADPDFVKNSGTSMAAPHVAGLAALLWDFGDRNGLLTDTTYLKAAILNNANRLANPPWFRPAQTQPLDVRQGTGEIDALESFRAYADDLRVWQQEVEGLDDSHWYWLDVTGAPIDVTVTLVFERHVSDPDNPPPLNDLDLKLYHPSGALASQSISLIDSVEHIVFSAPADGRYCVEVDPRNLATDGVELYAVAAGVPPIDDIRDFRLNFMDSVNPCIPDLGDAPAPYPTLIAENGAVHLDWTKEWLGTQRAEIDGELDKVARAVRSRVDPFPSVSGERDADGSDDQDVVPNRDDQDFYDDGVVIPGPFAPGVTQRITVTVQTTVDETGVGFDGRYDSGVPGKRLYLNAWADWNGDGDWDDGGEKIIGTGSATGRVAIDPETFGENGRFTIGETFTDDNGSGRWEPGEDFSDVFGKTEATLSFDVTPPGVLGAEIYCRFRLDYGEDAGAVASASGSLAEDKGVAAFGEVEDYNHAVEVDIFPDSLAQVDVRFPAGSTTPNLVELTGPTMVHVDLGSIADTDGDGLEQVTTEMVQVELEGMDPSLGRIVVRRRDPSMEPFMTTTGEIEEVQDVNPGTLDLPPFTTTPSDLCADSFFDVYFEVELVDMGMVLHNHDPKRMAGRIYHKPPAEGDSYTNPDFIPLFDESDVLTAEIGPSVHIPFPTDEIGEIDFFPDSLAEFDLRFPAQSSTPNLVQLTGPSNVLVDLEHIGDRDGDGREEVTTRMTQLDLVGSDPGLGTLRVRAGNGGVHPGADIIGEIEETVNHTPGVLDVPPFVNDPAGLTAQSFFDVYFEVELVDLGVRLHTHDPKRMTATITNKPPAEGDAYHNPEFIDLYDENEVLTARVGPGFHMPDPPPEIDEIDIFPDSLAQIDVRFPAGSTTPNLVRLEGPTVVHVNLPGIADTDGDGREQVTTDMVQLDLRGVDPDLGTVLVRNRDVALHPNQASGGEIEEGTNIVSGTLDLPPFTTDPPGLVAGSTFDVYVEVELPHMGLTLHAHDPKQMSGTITNKPPGKNDRYQSPNFISLFDDSEQVVAQLGPGFHIPNPLIPEILEPGFTVTTLAPGAGAKGLESAPGGSFGDDLYVADSALGVIEIIDDNDEMSLLATGLGFPVGMAFSLDVLGPFGDFLYVAEFGDHEISRLDPGGAATSFATVPAPGDCTFDPSGVYGSDLFCTTAFSGPIHAVDSAGNVTHFSDTAGTYLDFGPGGAWGSGLYSTHAGGATIFTLRLTANASIPDGIGPDQPGPPLDLPLTFPNPLVIDDLDVGVTVMHENISDLTITLESPGGQSRTLWDRGCDTGVFVDLITFFDDEGTAQNCNPGGPTPDPSDGNGNLAPIERLDIFDDTDAQGTWTISVVDNSAGLTGTVIDVTLRPTQSNVGVATVATDGSFEIFSRGYSGPEGFDWGFGPGFDGDMFLTDTVEGEVWRVGPAGTRSRFATVPRAADVEFHNCALYLVSADGGCWKITSDAADGDSDGHGDLCDNCPELFNPDQQPVIFGQTIAATAANTFSWSTPANVTWARGELSAVGGYTVDLVQSEANATSFTDPAVPSEGFFYVLKDDCPGGSWQTTLGSEPGRDASLP